jgi:hypothetical protein
MVTKVLRRIFGPKLQEVAGGWRRLHNEELHNLYTSPNIIRVIKSRKIRCAWLVERMGKMRKAYKFRSENLKDHSEDLGLSGKIILEWILGK